MIGRAEVEPHFGPSADAWGGIVISGILHYTGHEGRNEVSWFIVTLGGGRLTDPHGQLDSSKRLMRGSVNDGSYAEMEDGFGDSDSDIQDFHLTA